jgi:[acyl-carrier-protein] S-malonyltransferase
MGQIHKITLVFPGQGSQYVGMGKDLYEHFECVREVYAQASEILGYDLADICFKESETGKDAPPGRDLNKTIYTQPAVLATSYACFRALQESCRERGIRLKVSSLAGHSLGEYTALLVSGAMDFRTSLSLVRKRAFYMSDVGNSRQDAGLMAIMSRNGGLDPRHIHSLCRDYGVHITVNNSRRQIVVGGLIKHLKAMSRMLKKGFSTAMLKVEGPFHSPFMKRAASKLRKDLKKTPIRIAASPVVANVSKRAIVDPDHIKAELYEQIFRVVDWRGSMEKIIANGGGTFIELGPKRVLSRMFRDIDPSVDSLNVEDRASLQRTVQALATNN